MTSTNVGLTIPPSQEDDSGSSKFKPFYVAIIVIVVAFLLLLIGARCLSFRGHRRRAAAIAARPAAQSTDRGPWSHQMQQRESQAALCYEDWLRDVMQQQEQQPQRCNTQKTKRSRGLKVTSIRTTPTTVRSQDQEEWSGKRSPQLRVVKSDSSRLPCSSVSPIWREGAIDQGFASLEKEPAETFGLGLNMDVAQPLQAEEPEREAKLVDGEKEVAVDVKAVTDEKF